METAIGDEQSRGAWLSSTISWDLNVVSFPAMTVTQWSFTDAGSWWPERNLARRSSARLQRSPAQGALRSTFSEDGQWCLRILVEADRVTGGRGFNFNGA